VRVVVQRLISECAGHRYQPCFGVFFEIAEETNGARRFFVLQVVRFVNDDEIRL